MKRNQENGKIMTAFGKLITPENLEEKDYI